MNPQTPMNCRAVQANKYSIGDCGPSGVLSQAVETYLYESDWRDL